MRLKTLVLGAIITVTASTIAQNTFPANGNVGIGLTNPQYQLDVYHTARFKTLYASKNTLFTIAVFSSYKPNRVV